MGHLLMRGWILASLLLQTSVAMTVAVDPAAVTSTTTSSATAHRQHHWSYSSRSLPSRRPCTPSYSSSVPSSKAATPTPSIIEVPSSSPVPSPSTPSVRESPTPSSRPVPSRSAASHPHWSYVSRPLPQRSQCSASSRAIPSSSLPVSLNSESTFSAVPAPTTVRTGLPQMSLSTSLSAATVTDSSMLQWTTSAVLSTRTATITACPSTLLDCPAPSRTTSVTTETIVVSTTICPVTEAAGMTRTDSVSPTVTDSAANKGHGSGGLDFTTSTVFSTRTATVTACPSSVTNCPLRSKTTYVTTETLVVSTTVCPVADSTGSSGAMTTETAHPPSATVAVGKSAGSMGDSDITTSTILSTRIITVTACPSSVTNCPLRSKTTYASTETLVVGTAVYSVPKITSTKANGSLPSATGVSEVGPSLTTSTILSNRIATVAGCTGDNCSGSPPGGGYVTSETFVVATTVYIVYPDHTSVSAEGVDAVIVPTTSVASHQASNSAGSTPIFVSSGSHFISVGDTTFQGTGSSTGMGAESDVGSAADSSAVSNANSGADRDAVYTTTITVESCSNDGTCTEYGTTITMAQTSNVARPTVSASPYSYTPYSGSESGWNQTAPASSAHVWPQSSHQAGMSTAMTTSTRSASAVSALYTGAASAGFRWSLLQVVGTVIAMLWITFV
ncbi:hypothetical protein RIB2604_01700110 [Aspergillus luchuensis]|uniref:GPI anchored protein n=2 Tax=Aspergillus kawachii TaxID=1069201 RepID=A0A146FAA7_ASPKA|nr:hypothetical protein RIB2604_01700110 [Aspergillus luchuensis]